MSYFLEMTLVVLGVSFDDESLIVMIVFFKHLWEKRPGFI
jgi:hypothetical protein